MEAVEILHHNNVQKPYQQTLSHIQLCSKNFNDGRYTVVNMLSALLQMLNSLDIQSAVFNVLSQYIRLNRVSCLLPLPVYSGINQIIILIDHDFISIATKRGRYESEMQQVVSYVT